jgi:hypothetical protein
LFVCLFVCFLTLRKLCFDLFCFGAHLFLLFMLLGRINELIARADWPGMSIGFLLISATVALRPTSLGRAALLHPSAAHDCISPQVADISRRAVLVISAPVLAAGMLLLRPDHAGASYAMTQAGSMTAAFEARQATPKEMKRAVHKDIEVRHASNRDVLATIAAGTLTPANALDTCAPAGNHRRGAPRPICRRGAGLRRRTSE